MAALPESPAFKIGAPVEILPRLTCRTISLEKHPATGRAVSFPMEDFEVKLLPFYELINKSLHPQWGYCPPPEVNMGVNIPEFLDRVKPEARRHVSRYDIQRCVFASNTVHTNFVRQNGFVVVGNHLVYKPPGAVALDGDTYRPLGYRPENPQEAKETFGYQAMVLAPNPPRICEIRVRSNVLSRDADVDLAISGPFLVNCPPDKSNPENVVDRIPVRMKVQGQTYGNEINYDPMSLRSSFTVFGVSESTKQVVAASVFAGTPGKVDDDTTFYSQGKEEGVTVYEMAELMLKLGCSAAVLGGGAGDAQQFIHRQGVLAGQPRHQPDRPQVQGLRGLGAILAVFQRNG